MVYTLIPYRTKFRRAKGPKIWLAAENFVRRKFCPPEHFVRRNILSAEILSDKIIHTKKIKISAALSPAKKTVKLKL